MNKPDTYQWAVDGPPVGIWRTNSGSATMLMSSVLTLRSDGTGTLVEHSTLFGETEFLILWRVLTPGELQIYEGDEEYPEPEHESDWNVFKYRADWRVYDVGEGPVLTNNGTKTKFDLYPENGFWKFDSPVELIGRAE